MAHETVTRELIKAEAILITALLFLCCGIYPHTKHFTSLQILIPGTSQPLSRAVYQSLLVWTV